MIAKNIFMQIVNSCALLGCSWLNQLLSSNLHKACLLHTVKVIKHLLYVADHFFQGDFAGYLLDVTSL